jgi:hypothetical protein
MSIRRALLVGINDYLSPEVPDLRGCANDVAAWHDLLVRRGGFPERGIMTLLDGDATGLAIRSELERLLVDSKPGDVAFFVFSGHGTLTLTLDPTEATGVNQALCAVDMDWNDPGTFLEDDWICARICASRPGVAIRFIPDCCHSGSMTRTLGPPRSPAGHLCLLEPSARRSDLPDPPLPSRPPGSMPASPRRHLGCWRRRKHLQFQCRSPVAAAFRWGPTCWSAAPARMSRPRPTTSPRPTSGITGRTPATSSMPSIPPPAWPSSGSR